MQQDIKERKSEKNIAFLYMVPLCELWFTVQSSEHEQEYSIPSHPTSPRLQLLSKAPVSELPDNILCPSPELVYYE